MEKQSIADLGLTEENDEIIDSIARALNDNLIKLNNQTEILGYLVQPTNWNSSILKVMDKLSYKIIGYIEEDLKIGNIHHYINYREQLDRIDDDISFLTTAFVDTNQEIAHLEKKFREISNCIHKKREHLNTLRTECSKLEYIRKKIFEGGN